MATPQEPLKDRLHRRVRTVLDVPEGHGRTFRVAWALAGVLVVLAGLVMTVIPGPAVVVIPIGLAMLAGVFAWARRLVSTSIDVGVDAEQWVADLSATVKVVAVALCLCLAGALVTLVLR